MSNDNNNNFWIYLLIKGLSVIKSHNSVFALYIPTFQILDPGSHFRCRGPWKKNCKWEPTTYNHLTGPTLVCVLLTMKMYIIVDREITLEKIKLKKCKISRQPKYSDLHKIFVLRLLTWPEVVLKKVFLVMTWPYLSHSHTIGHTIIACNL